MVGNWKERPKMWKRFLVIVALAALSAATAKADIILGFTPDGTPTNFNVQVGQTIQVPLYLIERNQAPLSGNILANNGLVGAGVRVDYLNSIAGGGSGTAAQIDPAG